MDKENTTQEYKNFLESLERKPLNEFLQEFKRLNDNKDISYKDKFAFLNKFSSDEFNNLLFNEEFIKIFYLEPQAKYIFNILNLSDIDTLKTLIYCYNDNSREFNKNLQEERLKDKLLKDGFKEQRVYLTKEEALSNNSKELETKFIEEQLKPLHDKKVICIFDRDKIGFMGSFTEKGEYEGRLIFDEVRKCLIFLPKRHTKTGQILRSKFYYKEVK